MPQSCLINIPVQEVSLIITRTGRQKLPEWEETSHSGSGMDSLSVPLNLLSSPVFIHLFLMKEQIKCLFIFCFLKLFMSFCCCCDSFLSIILVDDYVWCGGVA